MRAAPLVLAAVAGLAAGCGPDRAVDSTARPPATPVAVATASAPVSPMAQRGAQVFRAYCISCHSVDGRGLSPLGVDLTTSDFVRRGNDEDLEQFLRQGRAADAHGSRTGRQMPGLAGLPDIGPSELAALVAHLREINRQG